jgi:3-deoxy-D-manno-octulosonic-acid transferase
MLSELYRYADFSLIGGGFHGALHNIIEPAVWGSHISFGPNYHKFPEAYDAIDHGFGFALTNENQWIEMIHNLLKEDHKLQEIKKLSSDYVITQQKATQKIAGYILN